jgi:hypothetical protein
MSKFCRFFLDIIASWVIDSSELPPPPLIRRLSAPQNWICLSFNQQDSPIIMYNLEDLKVSLTEWTNWSRPFIQNARASPTIWPVRTSSPQICLLRSIRTQYSVFVQILSVKRVTMVLSFGEGTHNQLVSSAKESGSASVSFSLIVICVGQLFGVRDNNKTLVT